MEEEDQKEVANSLQLPEDIYSDILEDDNYEDIGKLKDLFDGN